MFLLLSHMPHFPSSLNTLTKLHRYLANLREFLPWKLYLFKTWLHTCTPETSLPAKRRRAVSGIGRESCREYSVPSETDGKHKLRFFSTWRGGHKVKFSRNKACTWVGTLNKINGASEFNFMIFFCLFLQIVNSSISRVECAKWFGDG